MTDGERRNQLAELVGMCKYRFESIQWALDEGFTHHAKGYVADALAEIERDHQAQLKRIEELEERL